MFWTILGLVMGGMFTGGFLLGWVRGAKSVQKFYAEEKRNFGRGF